MRHWISNEHCLSLDTPINSFFFFSFCVRVTQYSVQSVCPKHQTDNTEANARSNAALASNSLWQCLSTSLFFYKILLRSIKPIEMKSEPKRLECKSQYVIDKIAVCYRSNYFKILETMKDQWNSALNKIILITLFFSLSFFLCIFRRKTSSLRRVFEVV